MKQNTQARTLEWLQAQPLNIQTAIIHDVLELARIIATSVMKEEVTSLAGERYSREKPHRGRYSRHGTNPGSIQLQNQRLPIDVPRVRNTNTGSFVPLKSYAELHTVKEADDTLLHAIIHGLGTRNYRHAIETTADAFGLSKSRISEQVVAQTTAAYKHLKERSLKDTPIVAMQIDGKSLQREQMIVVLGYDDSGKPMILDIIQASTENARAVGDMLRSLLRRGLKIDGGVLVVSDGGTGIIKALNTVLAGRCVHQRCRFHKAENVASYLPQSQQGEWKKRLFNAWKHHDYAKAKAAVLQCVVDLERINPSAAASLREGFEQTLTLQKLNMNVVFARSLATTNRIENLNRQLTRYTRNITNWCTADQRLRWVAYAALTAEQRMNKLHNYKHIGELKTAISTFLRKSKRRTDS